MMRPPEMWSSIEICSATRIGSCHGRTTTIEPSLQVARAAGHVGEELQTSGHIV